MSYESLKLWQVAIRILWTSFGLVGVLLLLRTPRWHQRFPAAVTRRRYVGLGFVVVAIVGHLATRELTSQKTLPLPGPGHAAE